MVRARNPPVERPRRGPPGSGAQWRKERGTCRYQRTSTPMKGDGSTAAIAIHTSHRGEGAPGLRRRRPVADLRPAGDAIQPCGSTAGSAGGSRARGHEAQRQREPDRAGVDHRASAAPSCGTAPGSTKKDSKRTSRSTTQSRRSRRPSRRSTRGPSPSTTPPASARSARARRWARE